MSMEIAPRRACKLCIIAILGQVGLASTAVASVWSPLLDGPRLGAGVYRGTQVDPTVAPAINVTLAVGRRDTRILASSHPSRKHPLPMVEADVRQDHLQRIIIAQLGGLHGP